MLNIITLNKLIRNESCSQDSHLKNILNAAAGVIFDCPKINKKTGDIIWAVLVEATIFSSTFFYSRFAQFKGVVQFSETMSKEWNKNDTAV